MELTQALLNEHVLIERVAGSFRAHATARSSSPEWREDGASFLEFFRQYAGTFHHAKEEDVLFKALIAEADVPEARGPIKAITAQHQAMAAQLDRVEALLFEGAKGSDDTSVLHRAVWAYADALLAHIDAENSVMIPESLERLRRAYVYELDLPEPTARQRDAEAAGRRLVERYPPLENPDLIRGDGCVACPAFGTTCNGLEVEWWSEDEWEDLYERARGD
jgi:hemerythrin-like domain-containing protein